MLVEISALFDVEKVELLNSALVHAGPVISLAFSANSAQLFTTSLDGTVFGLALEGLQEGAGPQPLPMTSALEARLVCHVLMDECHGLALPIPFRRGQFSLPCSSIHH